MEKVAVIGLGRFGTALAKALAAANVQVIAIDRSQSLISRVMDDVDVAVQLDSTDRAALLSQDVDKVDACVVSIGENFEAALLTTVHLLAMKTPLVICRAQTEFHAEIFKQIGAHRVIQPEREAGLHLARQLANPHLVDAITLAEGYTLIEFQAPKAFRNKSIRHLALRQEYDVNLVMIKRLAGPSTSEASAEEQEPPPRRLLMPKPDDLIEQDDILVVVGSNEALARLPKE